MKILVATQTKGGLDDTVSPVFGRAPTFTIVNVENGEIKGTEVNRNPAVAAYMGAGIQAAQLAINKGVDIAVAGEFGPNATMVFMQAGVRLISGYIGLKVRDIVKMFSGKEKFKPFVEQEKIFLEARKNFIENQLHWIKERLKQLEKEG